MKKSLVFLFIYSILCHSCQPENIEDNGVSPSLDKTWELVWADEFNYENSKLERNWISQNGPSSHILCSRWRENVVVSDGTLKLINKKQARGGQKWTSGSIWTVQTFEYGYFECRYKYAAAKATNNSFWLMRANSSDGSNSGNFEIDINEGKYPNILSTNTHDKEGNQNHQQFSFRNIDFSLEYHIFGLAWSEQEIIYYLDGKEIRRIKNDYCFGAVPIRLSLAIITWDGLVTDVIDGTQMEVDYVRVYKRKAE